MACMEGYIITLITFLHFPFSNVSSRCLHNWTKNCINYNSFDFLRYGFSMVSPWHFYQSTKSHTNCICLAFLQCSMTPVTPETLRLPRLLKLWDCMESREMVLVQGKMIFSFFLMFSTDEIYDTVLILCCCSTSVFRGDIKLCHWVSKGQCFSK